MIRLLGIISFTLLFIMSNAQVTYIPLHQAYTNRLEASVQAVGKEVHTSVRPWNPFKVGEELTQYWQAIDGLRPDEIERLSWTQRKLWYDHLIQAKGDNYNFYANFLFDGRFGRDSEREETMTLTNTRGFQVTGNLGKRFIFYSDFYENQSIFPQYIENFVQQNRVVPGQGMARRFKTYGRDYAHVNGYLEFQANEFINVRFGRGKNFWGDGYRSLLLSDNTFSYPYLRLETDVWRLQYVNLFTQMRDIRSTDAYGLFIKKYVTAHYLSFQVTKRLEAAIFEAVVYQDSMNIRGYDLDYLNPVIFYRPIEFALNSIGGNAMMGLNLKYKLTDKWYAYGQLLLDEFNLSQLQAGNKWWANKYGIQIGFKAFDVGIPNLMLQSEVNVVRPYTYSHRTSTQNYGHYNQALAHPLGSNFIESVTHLQWNKKRWFAELELLWVKQGLDTLATNWGANIYKPYTSREADYGNETLQGVTTTTWYGDLKIGYLVNRAYNARFEIGYRFRRFTPEVIQSPLTASSTHYFHIGLVTKIGNYYYDF